MRQRDDVPKLQSQSGSIGAKNLLDSVLWYGGYIGIPSEGGGNEGGTDDWQGGAGSGCER